MATNNSIDTTQNSIDNDVEHDVTQGAARDAKHDEALCFGNLSFGVTIGSDCETGREVVQFNSDRYRHTVILGRTGTGKSNLIQQMEREDIRNGAGCFILAAHEDDVLYPLSCVPEERMDDVVLIDASNPDYLPCMNPFDVDPNDLQAKDKAVNDILELLTMDCHPEWAGPRFEDYLRGGVGLLLQDRNPRRHCLANLYRVYTDSDYVMQLLENCTDEAIYTHWTKIIPKEMRSSDSGEAVSWFLSKVSRFAKDRALRHIFGAGHSTIDIRDVVDNGKILIAYVPASRIGSVIARTISKWLVMQLRDAILNRSSDVSGARGLDYDLYTNGSTPAGSGLEPFFVYVDEFSNFVGPDFETLLAQARKQHVGFILSTQTLSQTRIYDITSTQVGKMEDAILGNVGSMICYPVGMTDGMVMSRQFDIGPQEFAQIERYRPLACLCTDNQVGEPRTLEVALRPVPDNPTAARAIAQRHMNSEAWPRVSDFC